jgi:hypothetical protein
MDVFLGSQSLRPLELDGRREVGIIVHEKEIAAGIQKIFEHDWKAMSAIPADLAERISGEKLAKKVAKAVTRELPPVAEVVESVAQELAGGKIDIAVDPEKLEETVRDAVKTAVRDVIQEVALASAVNPAS